MTVQGERGRCIQDVVVSPHHEAVFVMLALTHWLFVPQTRAMYETVNRSDNISSGAVPSRSQVSLGYRRIMLDT